MAEEFIKLYDGEGNESPNTAQVFNVEDAQETEDIEGQVLSMVDGELKWINIANVWNRLVSAVKTAQNTATEWLTSVQTSWATFEERAASLLSSMDKSVQRDRSASRGKPYRVIVNRCIPAYGARVGNVYFFQDGIIKVKLTEDMFGSDKLGMDYVYDATGCIVCSDSYAKYDYDKVTYALLSSDEFAKRNQDKHVAIIMRRVSTAPVLVTITNSGVQVANEYGDSETQSGDTLTAETTSPNLMVSNGKIICTKILPGYEKGSKFGIGLLFHKRMVIERKYKRYNSGRKRREETITFEYGNKRNRCWYEAKMRWHGVKVVGDGTGWFKNKRKLLMLRLSAMSRGKKSVHSRVVVLKRFRKTDPWRVKYCT